MSTRPPVALPVPRSFNERGSRRESQEENLLPTLFWACFFFLACADLVFAVRIHGFNFRWGQLLLLGMAAFSLIDLLKNRERFPAEWNRIKRVGWAWAPFALVYGLAVSFSSFPTLGFIKLGWAAFNIGGAALVLLNPRWVSSLRRGFRWGLLALAAFIILQVFCLYFFKIATPEPYQSKTLLTLSLWGLHVPFGIAQLGYSYYGVFLYRPCAFYYEPGYAGSAFIFALPLVFWMGKGHRRFPGLVPGLIVAASFLTTSRTAILGCAITLCFLFAASFFKDLGNIRKSVLQSLLMSALGVGLLFLSPDGKNYLGRLSGTMGVNGITTRLAVSHTSEGDRVDSFKKGLKLWGDHFWLGQGYQPVKDYGGLTTDVMNTWLEVGTESGLIGLLAFLFALFSIIQFSILQGANKGALLFTGLAWVIHFLVNYNLTTTFPRLDYWLLFFFSINLLVFKSVETEPNQP